MSVPSRAIVGTFAAIAVAIPVASVFEGRVLRGYLDPIKVVTACDGHTKTAVLGKVYTPAQCDQLLAGDMLEHGLDIIPCLPEELPTETRAAFISAAYNIGAKNFCGSSMSRKALAGDLRGACNALPLWNKAGGKVFAGLVKRRAAEQSLCLKGLA